MKVTELSKAQLFELKQNHLVQNAKDEVSWMEVANAASLISDEEIFRYYDGINFTDDDFFTNTEIE